MKYKMVESGYYGEVHVPRSVFEELNQDYLISGCSETTKYMCANEKETEHLESLGIQTTYEYCDWFKIVLANP